ncbi:serine hydrolase [Rhizobium sp. 2MFCol3.1]|uniref:serine hydrolase domain-containing protein n=1 Tax=Rhizobium sp. 2MFCol3.1 TaxID=1246459 RepID=UPI000362DA2F|nr:serine hydrolase [Rhizobium sp. 2MFCol3.1]
MTAMPPSPPEGEATIPGDEWEQAPPNPEGWSKEHLAGLSEDLADGRTTALMVVEAGNLVFQWGDVEQTSSIASVRKSLISMLYGMFIAENKIDPGATLGELNIDDTVGLTATEKTATVLDLLKAQSGVYLPSVYDTEQGRPPRGHYRPGSHWFYNNWDFNVLGTILKQQTGQTVFEAFESRVARPLRMQDYRQEDCRFHEGPESRHPVYKMRLSARDLARVGLLYLREGRWGSTQVVPRNWVRDSMRPHSQIGGGRGYGYLWWTTEANAPSDDISTNVPIFYASGAGGQYIIVLPALDLVVVHRSAKVDHGISHARMGHILRQILAAKEMRR